MGGSNGMLDTQVGISGTSGAIGYLGSFSRMEFEGFRTIPDGDGETYGAADRLRFNGQLTRPLGAGALRVTLAVLDQDAENPGTLNAADFAETRNARPSPGGCLFGGMPINVAMRWTIRPTAGAATQPPVA